MDAYAYAAAPDALAEDHITDFRIGIYLSFSPGHGLISDFFKEVKNKRGKFRTVADI